MGICFIWLRVESKRVSRKFFFGIDYIISLVYMLLVSVSFIVKFKVNRGRKVYFVYSELW